MMADFDTIRLTVLGSRGSMPVTGADTLRFGGDTSCYLLEAGEETLILDAGTGLAGARLPKDGPVHILLSHTHVDHILGLPMFSALLQPGRDVRLYGRTRDGMRLEEQLSRLLSPPLWPVGLSEYPARVSCHELPEALQLGAFAIDGMEAEHPGGCTVLRVKARGKTVVYATDFGHSEAKIRELTAFSRGADLLLYDAQFLESELGRKGGYGHSTAEAGGRVWRDSGAKRLLLIHHDPKQTDEMLLRREAELGLRFARQGEVIAL